MAPDLSPSAFSSPISSRCGNGWGKKQRWNGTSSTQSPRNKSRYDLGVPSDKISHQVQVYFYWRALNEIFPEEFTSSTTASIWLLNQDAPTPFSPALLKSQMDSFLFSVLPELLQLPPNSVPWHYNSLCGGCRWQSSCRERTEREQTVSMIPDLNIEEAEFLREVVNSNTSLTDIEELASLVQNGLEPFASKFPSSAHRVRRILGVGRDFRSSPILKAVTSKSLQVRVSRLY